MKEIRYRLAKPSDAKQIAAIHYGIREQYDVGIFARLGKPFLRRYYSIMLNDPWEVVVCAEKEGRIMGFSSYTLDAAHQIAVYRKHRLALAFGALPSLIRRPSLIKLLWQRYRSTAPDSTFRFVSSSGTRGEYWAWDARYKDPISSVELDEIAHCILYTLGNDEVFFEVDTINKDILTYHKLNKAEELERLTLPDGRERVLMKYNLKERYKR